MRWQAILVDRRAGPCRRGREEHGGTGWSVTQKYIFGEECARAGSPGLIPLGLRMLAPVIFRYGTDEQKAEYLPKMLTGEHYWCQGYSEPGSGLRSLEPAHQSRQRTATTISSTAPRSGRPMRSSQITYLLSRAHR